MADLNTTQPPGGGNKPKMGKGLVTGIIVAILIVLALILFWRPSGSNDVEQATPSFGETDTFNTGVGAEGDASPANEPPFPEANDGLNVEF